MIEVRRIVLLLIFLLLIIPSLSQAAPTRLQGNNGQSSGEVSSVTFTGNDTVGSLLFAVATAEIDQSTSPTGDVTVTDSVGNTWHKICSAYYNYKSGAWQYNSLFYAMNTKGTGSEKITIAVSGWYPGSSYSAVVISEFYYSGYTFSLDGSAYGFQNGRYSTTGSVTLTGPSITPSVNGDLIYVFLTDDSAVTSDTFAAGSGFTIGTSVPNSDIAEFADEYMVQGTAAAMSPTFSYSSTSIPEEWTIFAAALRAAKTVGGDHTLTVVNSGTGEGEVTSTPSGINCGGTCSASYSSDTVVTLTATPNSSSTFTGWSGACTNASGACAVTMNAAETAAATFSRGSPSSYGLTVVDSGTGAGVVTSTPSGINCGGTCSASYSSGTMVTLTATPNSSSTFTGWSGACTNESTTCDVTVSAAETVTATFRSGTPSSDPQDSRYGKHAGKSKEPWNEGER
jgi:hypothetical protein